MTLDAVVITDEGLDATGKMQARRNIAKQLDDLRQSGDHQNMKAILIRKSLLL